MLTASTAWIIFYAAWKSFRNWWHPIVQNFSWVLNIVWCTWEWNMVSQLLKSILNRQKRDRRGLMTVMTAYYFKFLQRAPNYVWRMGEWNRWGPYLTDQRARQPHDLTSLWPCTHATLVPSHSAAFLHARYPRTLVLSCTNATLVLLCSLASPCYCCSTI